MRHELEMTLSSRRVLSETAAIDQITALAKFENGLLCPDKYGESEPIKNVFDLGKIAEAGRRLAVPQGQFFYRKGKPLQSSGQMWNGLLEPDASFPQPLFSSYWTAQFDGDWAQKVGIEKVINFASEMFCETASDFGLLTTSIDRKAKNTSKSVPSYQGSDLALGIPGLYWINFFSEDLANWLNLDSLPTQLVPSASLPNRGVMLQFCTNFDECRNIDVLQRQSAAVEWIGRDRFFDIRFPRRKLQAHDWGHRQ